MHTEEPNTPRVSLSDDQADGAPTVAKLAYTKPTLVALGDVRELTRGGGFTVSDFFTTRRKAA